MHKNLPKKKKKAYVINKHRIIKEAFSIYPDWVVMEDQESKSTDWDFKWMFYHKHLNYDTKNKRYQIGNKIENL